MKRQLAARLLVAIGALVTASLATQDSPALAQPAATIALPPPGAARQLYVGCNNMSLSFPDSTPSQAVVEAVTPAGAVESMWRHNAALNQFEGFSPAAPQASNLLTVNFMDAVWVCVAAVPPGATTPSAPAPPAQVITPAPLPVEPTADLQVTDLYPDKLPQGEVYVRITNNGPEALLNATAELTCSAVMTTTSLLQGDIKPPPFSITVSLNPGETQEFDTTIAVDNSCASYDVTCSVKASLNDPNTANDSHSDGIPVWSGGGWVCPF